MISITSACPVATVKKYITFENLTSILLLNGFKPMMQFSSSCINSPQPKHFEGNSMILTIPSHSESMYDRVLMTSMFRDINVFEINFEGIKHTTVFFDKFLKGLLSLMDIHIEYDLARDLLSRGFTNKITDKFSKDSITLDKRTDNSFDAYIGRGKANITLLGTYSSNALDRIEEINNAINELQILRKDNANEIK